jgi:hypothetical protein
LLVEGARPVLVPTFLAGLLVIVGLRRDRPRVVNEAEANFHEVVFYLLGAQNGSGPRLDGQQRIGDVVASPPPREAHARDVAEEPAEASNEAPAPVTSMGS